MKYRHKPVVIDAEQWTPCLGSSTEFPYPPAPSQYLMEDKKGNFKIKTPEGWCELKPFDWITWEIVGEYYPCKPDIFEKSYEKAEE